MESVVLGLVESVLLVTLPGSRMAGSRAMLGTTGPHEGIVGYRG